MSVSRRIPFQPEVPGADMARLVVLPFRKSLEISLKSLKVRLLRNLVTVCSLVLAVSFLAFALVGRDVVAGILTSGDPDLVSDLVKAGINPEVGAKERWIIILSLLVCAVGIVNAQLMAVTERFREIGTMKCLGALDSFILRLFLLEAAMQGLVGAVAGALLGGLIGLLGGLVSFGSAALVHLSLAEVGRTLLLSSAIGFGLSLAGVFYPAVVAARMRPVEAMRVEE